MDDEAWQGAVERAILAQDRAALRQLYAHAECLFGDAAPRRWAEAVSAFDALAVTG